MTVSKRYAALFTILVITLIACVITQQVVIRQMEKRTVAIEQKLEAIEVYLRADIELDRTQQRFNVFIAKNLEASHDAAR